MHCVRALTGDAWLNMWYLITEFISICGNYLKTCTLHQAKWTGEVFCNCSRKMRKIGTNPKIRKKYKLKEHRTHWELKISILRNQILEKMHQIIDNQPKITLALLRKAHGKTLFLEVIVIWLFSSFRLIISIGIIGLRICVSGILQEGFPQKRAYMVQTTQRKVCLLNSLYNRKRKTYKLTLSSGQNHLWISHKS